MERYVRDIEDHLLARDCLTIVDALLRSIVVVTLMCSFKNYFKRSKTTNDCAGLEPVKIFDLTFDLTSSNSDVDDIETLSSVHFPSPRGLTMKSTQPEPKVLTFHRKGTWVPACS